VAKNPSTANFKPLKKIGSGMIPRKGKFSTKNLPDTKVENQDEAKVTPERIEPKHSGQTAGFAMEQTMK
jgi:hypothetical protein